MYFVRFRAALRGKCRKVQTTDDADVTDKGIRNRAHETGVLCIGVIGSRFGANHATIFEEGNAAAGLKGFSFFAVFDGHFPDSMFVRALQAQIYRHLRAVLSARSAVTIASFSREAAQLRAGLREGLASFRPRAASIKPRTHRAPASSGWAQNQFLLLAARSSESPHCALASSFVIRAIRPSKKRGLYVIVTSLPRPVVAQRR